MEEKKVKDFLAVLFDFRMVLTRQEFKMLRGQALSGDVSGALKGLCRITERKGL